MPSALQHDDLSSADGLSQYLWDSIRLQKILDPGGRGLALRQAQLHLQHCMGEPGHLCPWQCHVGIPIPPAAFHALIGFITDNQAVINKLQSCNMRDDALGGARCCRRCCTAAMMPAGDNAYHPHR